MKDFTRPRGRLRSLPLPARVVYSVFLLFTLAAIGLTLWLGADMVGADLRGVGEYYAGEPRAAPAEGTSSAVQDGPQLDLPDDVDLVPAAEPMPLRKLLEVTHFHLFSMPVYLLILSHLFMLGRARDATKISWITIATVATAAHAAAPWIARAAWAGSTTIYAVSGALLVLSMLVMSLWPLWELWAPAPAAHQGESSFSD